MRDNKIADRGGPCHAGRKKLNLTGFMIAGAAAFFVGFAGNVLAVPFSTQNDVNAATRLSSLSRHPGHSPPAYSLNPGHVNQSYAAPTPFSLPGSVRAGNASAARNVDSWEFIIRRRIYGLSTPSPTATNQNVAPAGIPDGGSTAAMLGGVFCGLALVVRKLKA